MPAITPGAAAAGGIWVAVLTLVGLIVRQVSPWRKQSIDAQQAFQQGLMARIEAQDERIKTLESQLNAERANREAEVSIMRHENAQLQQIITMFVALIEADPSNARAHAKRVREEMEKSATRIAAEKATIRGAKIIAAGTGDEQ